MGRPSSPLLASVEKTPHSPPCSLQKPSEDPGHCLSLRNAPRLGAGHGKRGSRSWPGSLGRLCSLFNWKKQTEGQSLRAVVRKKSNDLCKAPGTVPSIE